MFKELELSETQTDVLLAPEYNLATMPHMDGTTEEGGDGDDDDDDDDNTTNNPSPRILPYEPHMPPDEPV